MSNLIKAGDNEKADWTTSTAEGCGAVREVCEALLKARGEWEKLIDQF